jgi:glucokinase
MAGKKIKVVTGIDLGGTNTRIGLVNAHGKILAKDSVATEDFPEPKEFVKIISEQICKLLFADCQLIGVGIGAPNGNFFSGSIEFAPNLPWKGKVPLAKMFSEKLKTTTLLTNDANAAALGEMIFGGAKGMKDFIFITLGTGLGSGIVVNGDLVYGHDGFAGEIGHTIAERNGRQCGCGRKGCLEQYCSASGIVKTYMELVQRKGNREQGKKTDAKIIYERAKAGEKAAIDSFNYTGEHLGFALANSAAYTSPEAIFLFGGLANAGKFIFSPTKKSFEKNMLSIWKNKIRILPSKLPENDAAILGAASLVWKKNQK